MNLIDRIEQLRACVAELEKQIDGSAKDCAKLVADHLREQQRVADLEAALRDAVGMLEELDGLDWGEEGMPFDVDFNHFAKVLARAESATPLPMREDPRYRGTDFRSAIDVDRASQGGGK